MHTTMKCAFFELETWEKEYFQSEVRDTELVFYDAPLSDETPDIASFEVVAVFIHSQLNKELLDKMPNLKFITTMSTGFDHIDIEECKRRSITVSNVPTYGETVVAEHTFALLLSISRRLGESVERVKKGNFMPGGLTGFELRGKTIGVPGVPRRGASTGRGHKS